MYALEANDLYRFYHVGDEETRALRGVSLRLEPGEFVAVMGASGSGKSTLLACLCGLDDPDGGQVTVAGMRLSRRPEAQRASLRARRLGVLLQTENLLEHLSVFENAQLVAGSGHDARLLELFTRVGLRERLDSRPSQLSGGELARAGLAVALAAQPSLLVADEPTAEVDAETEQKVLDVIEAFCRGGGAALIATHSAELARRADRVLHIKDGRLSDESGPR